MPNYEKQFYDLVYSKFKLDIPRSELMRQGRNFLKNIFSEKLHYMNGFIGGKFAIGKYMQLTDYPFTPNTVDFGMELAF